MIEPHRTARTTTEFILRSDFPNIFVTDYSGRDLYWVRSGVAQGIGLWSLRDLGGHELVSLEQEQTWPLPSYGVHRAGERVATVREAPGTAAARWRGAIRMLARGTPARLHYIVQSPGMGRLEVSGDPRAVVYHFTRAGRHVATAALHWLTWAARFGLALSVDDGEDPLVILTVAAMIESAWGPGPKGPEGPEGGPGTGIASSAG